MSLNHGIAPIVSAPFAISTPEMSISSKKFGQLITNKPVIYSAREVGRSLASLPLNYTGGLAGLRLASLIDF